MELTKKVLEDVKFKTRGKWYNGQQVDVFLDEMAVAAEEAERERAADRERLALLKGRIDELQREKEELQKRIAFLEEALDRESSDKSRAERDRLIKDIKALKSFREAFRDSVEHDAATLTEQVKVLESDKLL